MTTLKEDIIACFGKPTDHEFDPTKFLGRNQGRINILGLRYLGLVAAGSNLRKVVEAHSGNSYPHWEFMHAMKKWCEAYTSTDEPLEISKDGVIHQGILSINSSCNGTYFCIPPELNLTIETLKETG